MNASRDDEPSMATGRSVLLREYVDQAAATDRFAANDLKPILLGLFGEVGSIMATAKKLHREKDAYVGYRQAVEEEFGDALWYFAALCRRLHLDADSVLADATRNGKYLANVAASDLPSAPLSHMSAVATLPSLDATLLGLGEATAALLPISGSGDDGLAKLQVFADWYLHALQAAGVSFADVVRMNLVKARGRFLVPDPSSLPNFDASFPVDEQLPAEFEIAIRQRRGVQSYLEWNGVFIGDPLTDNIADPDGYRFHDVFHFAHAAVLHWSPTFRALIKHKRKSDPRIDEAQDGGRAIVVEEGLSAWIFSRAKELAFFEGQSSVAFDLLKTVGGFVRGYEVEICPLKLWEDAILQGYSAFRQVRANGGGRILASRNDRRITYKPL